jgi:hypothetical protein
MRASRLIFSCLLLSIFLGPVSPGIQAQTQIALGNATTPLNGPWKFRTGDNMAWAQPDFDDSAWATMDLTPPPGSFDPLLGSSGYLPGWTARGYKGYFGYAWYRLTTNVQDGQTRLAIKLPDDVDDAYQVYVNGQRIGEFGRFTARGVVAYSTQPRSFLLPKNFRGGPVTLAIRMWMGAFTPLVDPDAGGLHGPPVLGQASAIDGLLQLDWDVDDRANYIAFFQVAILLLALLVAFGLFWLDRKEPAYLWLGLASAALLSLEIVNLVTNYTTWLDSNTVFLLEDAVLTPATIGLWVLFWAYWFRLGQMARLHRMVWGLVAVLGLGMAMLRAPLYGSVVPVHAIVWLSPFTLALKLLLGALLVWVVYRGIYKEKAEGWLALPAVLLVIFSRYSEELSVLHVPTTVYPFGIGFGINGAATILSLGIITVLLLRRFLRGQHEREQFRMEIEQARQVQSLLIPSTSPSTPGYTMESVYLPASRVGGDFFHIRPDDDGFLLIVIGDVSGKGLKAAMTVSAIVGALRGCTLQRPAEVLAYLNRILHGQIGGFVTCCAAAISKDGKLALANAGHPSPYRNGEELATAGGLPLGIVAERSYEETRYQLALGDRLTFVSDGVVEATNEKRELFGFERTQQISHQPAAMIAQTAQQFGQEDDITVVSVVRAAEVVAAV